MRTVAAFHKDLEQSVKTQLHSQKVGYLLGAGSSYLEGKGYPLAQQLWGHIKHAVDEDTRAAIQRALDDGATGIEQALDQLDDGGAADTPYRHAVTATLADHFRLQHPPLDRHCDFLKRIAARTDPVVQVFSLNYDPLVERAAERTRVRLTDGFSGFEHAHLDHAAFEECPYSIRGSHRGRQFQRGTRPIQLLKLHGSLGWYEVDETDVRRCGFALAPPTGTRPLMVPPQRRKAADTMSPPYSALWSRFRGCLAHGVNPVNRLVSIGYGFGDHHVNEVIEPALARKNFTLLTFARDLSDTAWNRWSRHKKSIVVTETRCSLFGDEGDGHQDLWDFQRLAREL